MIRVYDVCIYLYIYIYIATFQESPRITTSTALHPLDGMVGGKISGTSETSNRENWENCRKFIGRTQPLTDYSVTNNFKLCSELTYQDMVRWLVIARFK